MRFTGECEGLKDCVFDCSDGKQARNFDKNMKRLSIFAAGKYERGAEITTLIDELVEVEISKPKFYECSDPGEQRIYDLKINQYGYLGHGSAKNILIILGLYLNTR